MFSILNYFKEKKLFILILEVKILILIIKKISITLIDINTYFVTCKFKKTQVFAIFLKNLKY